MCRGTHRAFIQAHHTNSKNLTRHPSRSSSRPERGGKAEAARAHGEIADKIPYQARNLDESREKGQNSILKLHPVNECPESKAWGYSLTHADGKVDR